jgi:hypothetical protein
MTGEYPTSTFPSAMESSNQPNGSRSWRTGRSPDSTNSKALMSPLTLSTYMCKLTQMGMARKTPSNHSPPGSMPSSSGPAVTSCTCSATLATLTTGGWLGRSLASVSSIKKPLNSPHEPMSYMKSSTRPVMPEPCLRSDWSSPVHPGKQHDSKTSRRRLACCPHTLIAKTTINEDISSNRRVMLLALRTPGGYRSPHLM